MEGIEIHRDVIAHCQNALKAWSTKKSEGTDTKTSTRSHPQIIHGNGLFISSQNGEAMVGFDRMYIGAATERDDLARMSKLLSPGGILVAPGTLDRLGLDCTFISTCKFHSTGLYSIVSFNSNAVDDQLIRITRSRDGDSDDDTNVGQEEDDEELRDARDEDASDDEEEGVQLGGQFDRQILSGVRFASLLKSPALSTVIPATVWTPGSHKFYPDTFQKASRELLLCANSEYVQPLPIQPRPEDRINVACTLPKSVWTVILSFTHRGCKCVRVESRV